MKVAVLALKDLSEQREQSLIYATVAFEENGRTNGQHLKNVPSW